MAENSRKTARGRPFPPGQSGNPGGRPALTEVQRTAREARTSYQLDLVKALYAIAMDPDERTADRIVAAKALLDDTPIEVAVDVAGEITDEERAVRVAAILERAKARRDAVA